MQGATSREMDGHYRNAPKKVSWPETQGRSQPGWLVNQETLRERLATEKLRCRLETGETIFLPPGRTLMKRRDHHFALDCCRDLRRVSSRLSIFSKIHCEPPRQALLMTDTTTLGC